MPVTRIIAGHAKGAIVVSTQLTQSKEALWQKVIVNCKQRAENLLDALNAGNDDSYLTCAIDGIDGIDENLLLHATEEADMRKDSKSCRAANQNSQ